MTRWTRWRKAAVLAVSTLLASAGIIGITSPAAHAVSMCTGSSSVYIGNGISTMQPTRNGSTNCQLWYGTTGYGVLELQMALNHCHGTRIAQDRSFGPATREALKSVQRKIGARPDGNFGPETRNLMRFWTLNGGCEAKWVKV